MNLRLSALASALLIAVVAGQHAAAQATNFTVSYTGVTSGGSFLGGQAIANGTSFDVLVGFNTSSKDVLATGIDEYAATSLTIEIGSKTYTALASTLSDYDVILLDKTNQSFSGYDIPGLENVPLSSGFGPAYSTTSTANWSAASPSPTTFSAANYVSSLAQSLYATTSTGSPLVVDYSSGITTTIASVDEGNSSLALGLMSIGAIGVGFAMSRRGRIAVHSAAL